MYHDITTPPTEIDMQDSSTFSTAEISKIKSILWKDDISMSDIDTIKNIFNIKVQDKCTYEKKLAEKITMLHYMLSDSERYGI